MLLLSASVNSVQVTAWKFCSMWPTQLQALLSGNWSSEGLTPTFPQTLSRLKS